MDNHLALLPALTPPVPPGKNTPRRWRWPAQLKPITTSLAGGLLYLALCYPALVIAQDAQAPAPSSSTPSTSSPSFPTTPTPTAAPTTAAEPPPAATSPRARRKQSLRLCHRYNGKVISYYDKTYVVKNCQRVPMDHAVLTAHLKAGKSVSQVSNEIINLIPLQRFEPKVSPKRLRCKDLEGNYVTMDHEEVYYIKGCKKKRFPDWHTYREHRFHTGPHSSKFLLLTAPDLQRLRSRDDFPSTLPSTDQEAEPPVLNAQKVCAELEGEFVGYYSQLYFVDACSRRPVDTIQFARLMAQLMVGTTPVPDLEAADAASTPATDASEPSGNEPVASPAASQVPDEIQTHADAKAPDESTTSPAAGGLPQVIKITDTQWMSLPLGKAYDLKNYTPKEP